MSQHYKISCSMTKSSVTGKALRVFALRRRRSEDFHSTGFAVCLPGVQTLRKLSTERIEYGEEEEGLFWIVELRFEVQNGNTELEEDLEEIKATFRDTGDNDECLEKTS